MFDLIPGVSVFTGRHTRTTAPAVSIQARGALAFNAPAFLLLGEPKAVLMGYQESTRTIVMRSVPPETPHAFPVRPSARSDKEKAAAAYLISSKSFFDHYGIDYSGVRQLAIAQKDNIIYLSEAEAPGDGG